MRKDAQNHSAGSRQRQLVPVREVMVQDDYGEHNGGKTARAKPPDEEPGLAADRRSA